MARIATYVAEPIDTVINGLVPGGASTTIATDPATGRLAWRFNDAGSGGSVQAATVVGTLGRAYYARTYVYYVAAPGALLVPLNFENSSGFFAGIFINSSFQPQLVSNVATHATGTALSTGVRYRFELRALIGTGATCEAEARVYVGDSLTPAQTLGPVTGQTFGGVAWDRFFFGNNNGVATPDSYFSEVAYNDDTGGVQNTWLGPGVTYALRPVAAGTAGTAEANWTKPGGATTSKWTSVDNAPFSYQADSTSAADAEKMLRNPTNAASDLTLACTDYTTAGIPASSTINVVEAVAVTGSSSATDTAGGIALRANPDQGAQSSLTTFDNGIASTSTTTWRRASGGIVQGPTVVRGTQPQVRLNRAASALTVLTNGIAVIVDATPATGAASPVIPRRAHRGLTMR